MEILAIIPARKGSKGIKNKNIVPLCGHPLIAYSITAAKKSKNIKRVICSTNSKNISKIAKKYGAEVPFLRPEELSGDSSSDYSVFKHTLDWLDKNENYVPDIVVHLRPTSPLRNSEMMNKGINILKKNKKIDSIRSVAIPLTTPFKMWKKKNNGQLKPLLKIRGVNEPFNTARQLLPEIWAQTGTLDIIRANTILKQKSMTGKIIFPLEIDPEYYVDVDNKFSLILAEIMMKKLNCFRL